MCVCALVGVLIKWLYEMHGATVKIVINCVVNNIKIKSISVQMQLNSIYLIELQAWPISDHPQFTTGL